MADYFETIILKQLINPENVSKLELLFFEEMFDVIKDPNGYLFLSKDQPESGYLYFNQKQIDQLHPSKEELEYFGLTEENLNVYGRGTFWEIENDDSFVVKLFQSIIRKSNTLDRVDIIYSYTCSKKRFEGFGAKKIIVLKDSFCVISTFDEPDEKFMVLYLDEPDPETLVRN